MKRILCLIDSLGAGGAQRQLVGLATLLKRSGYEVNVVFYHKTLFYADLLNSEGVPFCFYEKAEKSSTRIYHIARYIRNERPDVVISYLDTPNICACISKLFYKGCKVIVSERSSTQKTGLKEQIRFNTYRLANLVVPNSYAQANYIESTFPFLSKKVKTIPNFVDLNKFSTPLHRKRGEVYEVIVAASIYWAKNTLGLIEAVAKLRDLGYVFHISWYGYKAVYKEYQEYYNNCLKKIESLGLQSFIELKEKTNDISECYQKSDYFCLPSFYEGTPNVICEAMACGLPIVCSDVCDNGRYVCDGENGFLFDPHDVASIVSTFERLFNLNEEDYNSFSRKSRDKAEKQLSEKRFVDDYIALIEE